jgi:hypothetical protein
MRTFFGIFKPGNIENPISALEATATFRRVKMKICRRSLLGSFLRPCRNSVDGTVFAVLRGYPTLILMLFEMPRPETIGYSRSNCFARQAFSFFCDKRLDAKM